MRDFVLRIMILRHAHAAKATPGQDDFGRQLDERGRREATQIGALVQQFGLIPELILCSPAARTRGTLAEANAALASARPEYRDTFYPGDAAAYLAAVREVGGIASVMLIGHNPGVAELANLLVGSGDADAMRRLELGVPTAGLAVVEFDGPPGKIEPGTGRLQLFLVPER